MTNQLKIRGLEARTATILLLVVLLYPLFFASVSAVTTFNNSLSVENVTLGFGENFTRYLSSPIQSFTYGRLNITLFNLTEYNITYNWLDVGNDGSKEWEHTTDWKLETHTHVLTSNENAATGGKSGMQIWVRQPNVFVGSINKEAGCDATKAYVLNDSKGVIATAFFSGNKATFIPAVSLIQFNTYYLTVDKAGSAYTARLVSASLPVNSASVNWTKYLAWDNSEGTNYAYSVWSANFTNQSKSYEANVASSVNSQLAGCSVFPCNVSFVFWSNTSSMIQYSNLQFDNRLVENSVGYTTPVSSGVTSNFTYNITYDSSNYTGISANLIYNNTIYPAFSSDTGNNVFYNLPILIPVTATQTNKSFYWELILSNSSGLTYINSTRYNQTIQNIIADNCTVNSIKVLNIDMHDEDTFLDINGTIEVLFNLYALGTSDVVGYYNASFSYIGKTISVCMNSTGGDYSYGYKIRYNANTTYFTEYKELQRATLSSATLPQNVSLYDLLSSNGYTFTVNVVAPETNQNLLVDVQRDYVGINQFLSVESSATSADGTMVAHLIPGSVVYNFVVSQDGVVLGTFNRYNVKCNNVLTGDCSVTLNLYQSTVTFPNYTYYPSNVSLSYSLSNNTRILSLSYASTDGNAKSIQWYVLKNDGYANTTICSKSAYGNLGTITCDIPSSYGDVSLYSQVTVDGQLSTARWFYLTDTSSSIFFGVRTILLMLLFSSLTLLMVANPTLMIIGSMMGMLIGVVLFVADGGSVLSIGGFFLWFVIAGGIIIWQISKKIV